MANADATVPESVLAALQSSGFPFQTAVAHVIDASPGWSVYESEYPWQSLSGDGQFLDLVATNGNLLLTIECKKTRKETMTFLRPLGQGHTGERREFQCLRAVQIQDATRRLELFCEEWSLHPQSPSSAFCVVSTSESGRDQRLLERDANLLVRATDAFAHDFRERFNPGRDPAPSAACLFLPVIVTNAPIYTARYTPTEVSLETGEFSAPPQDIKSVPCVRFRKAFTSDGGPDLGDRSVFVVHAVSFAEFLKLVAPAPNQLEDKTQVQLRRRTRH